MVLDSGDKWHGELLEITGKKLRFRGQVVGERTVDLGRVVRVDFFPGQPERENLEPGTLYRAKGESIPGDLLWVDAKELAIDSPLGVLRLPRQDAARYVFRALEPNDHDQRAGIQLLNGSIIDGRWRFRGDGLVVQHDLAGEIVVPFAAARIIQFERPGVFRLARLRPERVDARSLLGGDLPRAVFFQQASRWNPGYTMEGLDALVLQPDVRVSFAMPARGVYRFTASLSALARARGSARLALFNDGKQVYSHVVKPGTLPVRVSADLHHAKALTIQVAYSGDPLLPSGAVLTDPLLIRTK